MNRITPSEINQNFLNELEDKYTKEQINTMMESDKSSQAQVDSAQDTNIDAAKSEAQNALNVANSNANADKGLQGSINTLNSTVAQANLNISKLQYDVTNIGGPNYFEHTQFNTTTEPFGTNQVGNMCSSGFTDKFETLTPIYSPNMICLANFGPNHGELSAEFCSASAPLVCDGWQYTISFIYAFAYSGGTIKPKCELITTPWTDAKPQVVELMADEFITNASKQGQWLGYSYTFYMPQDTKAVTLKLGIDSTENAWLVVDGIKLEPGAVATGYVPSYLDTLSFEQAQVAVNNYVAQINPATVSNLPTSMDMNDFTQANSQFLWDTGNGGLKNTPYGNVAQASGFVFQVSNVGGNYSYGNRVMQTCFVTNEPSTGEPAMWYRVNNSNSGTANVWSEWVRITDSRQQLLFLNQSYYGQNYLPPDITWASSTINGLPILGGVHAPNTMSSESNIVFVGPESNCVNMVIDGEFYGVNGRTPVIKTLQNNNNAINALQSAVSGNANNIKSIQDGLGDVQNGHSSLANDLFVSVSALPSNDLDSCIGFGAYAVGTNNGSDSIKNMPSGSSNYGILVVYVVGSNGKEPVHFTDNNGWVWQNYYDTGGGLWYRSKINSAAWTPWTYFGQQGQNAFGFSNVNIDNGEAPTNAGLNSSVAGLGTLGGLTYTNGQPAGNIVFNNRSNNGAAINMVIDGEYYTGNGDFPVRGSIMNNTNAINALQSATVNNANGIKDCKSSLYNLNTEVTNGLSYVSVNGTSKSHVMNVYGTISQFNVNSGSAQATIKITCNSTLANLSSQANSAIANNQYSVENVNFNVQYVGKANNGNLAPEFNNNFISIEPIDSYIISDNGYRLQFQVLISNLYEYLDNYIIGANFSAQIVY